MHTTTIETMFTEAFGLTPATMRVGVPVYVAEANVGVLSQTKTGEIKLARILYCIKKKKTPFFEIGLANEKNLRVSADHLFKVDDLWLDAKTIYDNNNIETLKFKTVDGFVYGKYIKKLRKDNPLDIQVEDTECYFSQGILSHNSMYGPDYKVTGGRAIKFYASHRSRVTRIDYVKDKGNITGIQMKVKNGKNKTGIPFREAELTLMFESGFDTTKEYMDFIISLGLVEQHGPYFSFKDPQNPENDKRFLGRDKLQAWLDENPDINTLLKTKVDELLCTSTVLDANNKIEEDSDGVLTAEKPPESEENI